MKSERKPRPKETGILIGVRLQVNPLATLDAWIATLPDPKPSRPEAIRRIVDGWFVARIHETSKRDEP